MVGGSLADAGNHWYLPLKFYREQRNVFREGERNVRLKLLTRSLRTPNDLYLTAQQEAADEAKPRRRGGRNNERGIRRWLTRTAKARRRHQ